MKIRLIILFLLGVYGANCQKETSIIIDWQNFDESIKEEVLLESVPFARFHSFQIININKFLYKVTVQGENIELETPVPTELQTLFRMSIEERKETTVNTDLDNEVKQNEKVKNNLNNAMLLTKTQVEAADAVATVTAGAANEAAIAVIAADLASKTAITAWETKLASGVVAKVEQGEVKAADAAKAAADAAKAAADAAAKKQQQRLTDIIDFMTKQSEFNDKFNSISETVYNLKLIRVKLVNHALKDIPFSEMETILADNKLVPKDPSSELFQLKKKFAAIQSNYTELTQKYSDLKNQVEESFKVSEQAMKTLNDETILVLFGEVDYLYGELGNKNNFIVNAPPVQAQEDFVNYEISIKPSKTNTLGAHKNPVTVDFDVPVRGGLKVDFSVGPAFSFGDKARDEQFFFEKVDTTENVRLRARSNNNAITPSIGAFMHFYRRSGTNISFGGLFGVGTGLQNLDDFQVNYYAGLSLVLGKNQKIMLSSGASFLRVDRLKDDQFEVDEEYMKNEFDIADVVEKVYKPSFFLSLTYSLGNRRRR